MKARTITILVWAVLLAGCAALMAADDSAQTDHGLSVGEAIATVMAALFALSFAAWAKRLDKALDLLEKIQESMHKNALRTERRLTTLEQVARQCGNHVIDHAEDGDE